MEGGNQVMAAVLLVLGEALATSEIPVDDQKTGRVGADEPVSSNCSRGLVILSGPTLSVVRMLLFMRSNSARRRSCARLMRGDGITLRFRIGSASCKRSRR